VPFTRLGFYTFAGAIPEWTLFHGHYYQFPVYEALTVGAMFTGFAALRFFVDDRGLTFAEKGVRNLDLYSPKRVARRTCALVGAVNLIMFASYSVPLMYLGIHSGEWPRDIVGPETDYACPGPNVPIPRKNSQYVDNEGQLAGGTQ
jgi:hypothetical protein